MTTMMLCDKCRGECDEHHYFMLSNPILGTYYICDACSLALDRFIDSIDKRIESRGKRMLQDIAL